MAAGRLVKVSVNPAVLPYMHHKRFVDFMVLQIVTAEVFH